MNYQRKWAYAVLSKLRATLGGVCATCGTDADLEFDCIEPQGDKHHRWETNRRAVFYRRQHGVGNLQLLCKDCHAVKTRADRITLDKKFGVVM